MVYVPTAWVDGPAGNTAITAARLLNIENRLVAIDNGALGVYFPEAYGAVGDGTTDDTAAIQACFNAVPVGALVRLTNVYKIATGPVTVSKKLTISGDGGFNSALFQSSGFVTASTTLDCLVINAHGCTLTDFSVVNTSMPAGPFATAGNGINVQQGDDLRIDRVDTSGFWNNLSIDHADNWVVSNCRNYDAVNYGMYLRNTVFMDNADSLVTGCTIGKFYDTTARGTAVRWESGGGLKFVGNKINAGGQPLPTGTSKTTAGNLNYGLDIAVVDGVATGVFVITGNSIENITNSQIRVIQDPAGPAWTGNIAAINISGNEIGFGSGAWAIEAGAHSTGQTQMIKNLYIGGNTIQGTNGGIWLHGVSGCLIAPNRISNTSGPAVQIDPISYFVDVLPQLGAFTTNRDVILDNRNLSGQFKVQSGHTVYDYDNQFQFTSVNTWLQQFLVQGSSGVDAYGSSALLELTLHGGDTVSGPFFARYQRYLISPNNGAIGPSLTLVGTDIVSGQIAAQFVVTGIGAAATVSVQVQVPTAAGTTVCAGQAILKVTGMLKKFHVGT
jgi:parallel beta-helix repeat protein